MMAAFHVIKSIAIQSIIWSLCLFYNLVFCVRLVFSVIKHGTKILKNVERTLPPSCLHQSKYGKHHYINLTKIRLHYVANGDPKNPLMLFVHGFPEFWFSWRHQMEYFSKTHYVVAFDMRGYGDSGKPEDLASYKMDDFLTDIKELITALNHKQCILVGHDWGAAICYSFAEKYPKMVQKMIILNMCHASAFKTKISSSITQLLKSWYIFFFQMPCLPEMSMKLGDMQGFKRMFSRPDGTLVLEPEELEAYKYTFGQKGAWTPPINYYRNAFTSLEIAKPISENTIKVATLTIWGEKDLALEKDMAQMSAKYVDNFTIHYIPDGTHFIQQDKPAIVNEKIKEFIS